jgi:hypothetical protein
MKLMDNKNDEILKIAKESQERYLEILQELEDFANDVVHSKCDYSEYLQMINLVHELNK